MGKSISLRAALIETLLILRANPINATLLFLLIALLALGRYLTEIEIDQIDYGMVPRWILIAVGLLSLWIVPGMHLMALRAASGESWNAGQMFAGGRWIWCYCCIFIVVLIPITIINSLGIPLSPTLDTVSLQQAETISQLVYSFFPHMEIENQVNSIYSPWSPIAEAGFFILIAAVWAAFSFSWYLAIDKEMGMFNAINYGFELVQNVYQKVLIWNILILSLNILQHNFPEFDILLWLIRASLSVFSTFVLAILYRERLRQWEAEAGQPLRHESMLSLPREPSNETGLPDNLSGA